MNEVTLKQAEVSVNRFNKQAVPHYVKLLDQHRTNIESHLAKGDWKRIRNEEIDAALVIKQLKNLMLDMVKLRDRLPSAEAKTQYDAMTDSGHKAAFASMKQFIELKLKTPKGLWVERNNMTHMSDSDDDNDEKQYQYEDDGAIDVGEYQMSVPQIQTKFQKEEYKLAEREACLDKLEEMQQEIVELHDLFCHVGSMVVKQGESVQAAADNAEEATMNVMGGEEYLRKALSYKKTIYPVMGAFVGALMGGPIGLVAGVKVGGLASFGCAMLGYTGGSVLKNNPAVMQGGIIEHHEENRQDDEPNASDDVDATKNDEATEGDDDKRETKNK